MGKYASEIIALAESKVGVKEGSAEHKKMIDTYNKHKPLARGYTMKINDNWCMMYLAYLSIKLGYTDIIPTECSCGEFIKLCQNMGIWVENENTVPEPGWITLYDWKDDENFAMTDNKNWPGHAGLITRVVGNKFYVNEGNAGDKVAVREMEVNGRYIRGFVAPKYDVEVQEKSSTVCDVGDVVEFTGTIHYTSAYAGGVAKACKPGKAKVVNYYKGKPHPYLLEAVKGSGSTVCGYVDVKDIKTLLEVAPVQPSEPEIASVNISLVKLQRGSTGKQVETLQCILVGRGYDIGSDPIDGFFGEKTEAGVKQYQADHGLTVDGVVGIQTWTSMLL